MNSFKAWSTRVLLFALLALLAACGTSVAVLSVNITEEYVRLAQGESMSLTVEVEVTGTESSEVDWSSSSTAVATVNQDGVVTAVNVGIATITAISTADTGKRDQVTVQVIAPPANDSAPAPGESDATVNGTPATVTTSFTAGGVGMAVGATELVVGFRQNDGATLPVTPGGVPRVTENGHIEVSGTGYKPSSSVDVWLFSDPKLLGSPRTDGNGTFSASFPMPDGVESGQHSMVIDGVMATGSSMSMRLGIEVQSGTSLVEFAHCPAGSDWFVSSENGAVDAGGTSVANPLLTIQAAVVAAASGDVVCVSAGTYAVDNSGAGTGGSTIALVNIDKPLEIYGPNTGVSGAASRGPEAELVVSSSEADTLYAFAIEASDVVIDGFLVTTLTPKTDPYPDGIYGIFVGAGSTESVTIRNNHLVNTNFPIWVNRGRDGGGAAGFVIEANLIEGPNAESDQGILMQAAFGQVQNNVIRDARVGIQIQPYQFEGTGTVSDNDIEAFQAGLWFNYQQHAGASWAFDGNDVVGVESPWGWPLYNSPDVDVWSGIRVETFQKGTVSFSRNSVAVGTANPPVGAYLLRQRTTTDGQLMGIGTEDELGSFFTDNNFSDFGTEGVTASDLSVEDGLIQLKAPAY